MKTRVRGIGPLLEGSQPRVAYTLNTGIVIDPHRGSLLLCFDRAGDLLGHNFMWSEVSYPGTEDSLDRCQDTASLKLILPEPGPDPYLCPECKVREIKIGCVTCTDSLCQQANYNRCKASNMRKGSKKWAELLKEADELAAWSRRQAMSKAILQGGER